MDQAPAMKNTVVDGENAPLYCICRKPDINCFMMWDKSLRKIFHKENEYVCVQTESLIWITSFSPQWLWQVQWVVSWSLYKCDGEDGQSYQGVVLPPVSGSVIDDLFSAVVHLKIFKHALCHIKIYFVTISVLILYLLERDPSLSIRYRKKNRDKDIEPERVEKRSSTPEYKIDKRRGSKVSVSSVCSYI